jgi:5-methylcytosine-specific restriction endonuclease McrA
MVPRAPPAQADSVLRLLARAGTRGRLRLALARIAARVIATRSWERLGFARLGDYARERVGLSARQLQDLAHTSERLAALPVLEEALASGQLGWSQARLIARVATPENAALWVAFARRVRVRELEHAVRAVDRGSLEGGALEIDEEGSDTSFHVGIVVRCTPRVRAKFHAARALARRVAGEKLPAWACMEAVAAEALSALPAGLDPQDETRECSDAGEGGARSALPACASRAEAPAAIEAALGEDPALAPEEDPTPAPEAANMCALPGRDRIAPLEGGLDTADAFELDARLRRAARLEQRLDAELAPLLASLALPSLEAFARERLGMSPRKARALRRIGRAAAGCPELGAAFRSGRLSWVQVQAILPVLWLCQSEAPRARWIEFAAQVSVRRLQDEVDDALARGVSDPPDQARQTCAETMDAEGTPCACGPPQAQSPPEREDAQFFFHAPPDVARLFRSVVCSVRRCLERATGRLPSQGAAIEWMFDHACESWGGSSNGKNGKDCRIPREHQVFERDGWRCTVPGCSSYRNLHDHHIVFRSAGGSDELANRTTLCAWHHLRGVHAARVRCTGTAPGALIFELGLRPGRGPLLRYVAGER